MKRSHVRGVIPAVLPTLVAACAGTPEIAPDIEAIRDYVEVGELKEAGSVRTQSRDTWTPATAYFAVYEARDGYYLFEFSRACREMFDNSRITPDRRYDHNVMRRGIDTLRGCRIDKMYELTEAQALEIEALARSAGGN